ncbi:diacylglycerol kinase [Novosphingobium colocasiae]|uniref:Diacylglycerol kinase n=2 Tax=Novosphingobium colocasiae TaxID=1256513 RepID=A0A918UEW4_9SPHN|nr:diacylglycerol kinase [Novosphingobium colocasiae]
MEGGVHGTIYEFEALPALGKQVAQESARRRRAANAGPAVALVGIIRNPRSHRNKGVPAEMEDCSNILTRTPKSREELHRELAGFAQRGIDYLVVDGGDGTVRDVLSCGAEIFDEAWPTLIVLPKGKTNALAVDLGLPTDWTLTDAMAAVRSGDTLTRRPLRIRRSDDTAMAIQGFIMGTGVYSHATQVGQEAHRRGAFNSLAVGVTVLWGIIQALFGGSRNPWRKATRTRLTDRQTRQDLPRSRRAARDERYLTIATTFERFPLGARPFGRDVAPGLKLALIDAPVRWVVALLPLVIFGIYGRLLKRAGLHRVHASEVEMDLDGTFVLDGESFPAGHYIIDEGPLLTFVVP